MEATAELFDPVSATFAMTGSLLTPRQKHGSALLTDGRVLIVGGSSAQDFSGKYASAEVYDPATRVFHPAGSMHSARFKIPRSVASLTTGELLVAGDSATLEYYEPRTSAFQVLPGSLDAGYLFQSATTLSDGRVLIAGGYDDHIISTARAWLVSAP